MSISNFISSSCFPHIVNLACRAVLTAITDLKYVDDTIEGYQDYEPGFSRDVIAIIRSLVNAVSIIYNQSLLLLRRFRFLTAIVKNNNFQKMF